MHYSFALFGFEGGSAFAGGNFSPWAEANAVSVLSLASTVGFWRF